MKLSSKWLVEVETIDYNYEKKIEFNLFDNKEETFEFVNNIKNTKFSTSFTVYKLKSDCYVLVLDRTLLKG